MADRETMTLGDIEKRKTELIDSIRACLLEFYEDTGLVAHVQLHAQERDGEPPEIRASVRLMLGE